MTSSELLSCFWDGYLPVDIMSIARHAGFYVTFNPGFYVAFVPNDNTSDLHEFSGELGKIAVGEDAAARRQRWAVAHAIGRIYSSGSLPFTTQQADFSSDNKDLSYANRFAADLLMPEKVVLYAIGKGTTDVDKLSELFGVAPAAMAYQLSRILKH